MIRKALVLASTVMLLALFAGTALAASCCDGNASWAGVSPGRAGWGASGPARAALPDCCQTGANTASSYKGVPPCCQTGATSIPTYTPAPQSVRSADPTAARVRTIRGPVKSPYTVASFEAPAASIPARSLQVRTEAPSKPVLPPCCEAAAAPPASFGQVRTVRLLSALSSNPDNGKAGTAGNGLRAGNASPVVQAAFTVREKPTVWGRPAASPALGVSGTSAKLAPAPSCCADAGTPVKPLTIAESPTGSYFNAPVGCGRANCAGGCSLR